MNNYKNPTQVCWRYLSEVRYISYEMFDMKFNRDFFKPCHCMNCTHVLIIVLKCCNLLICNLHTVHDGGFSGLGFNWKKLVCQFGTIEIHAEFFRKTMIPITHELFQFSETEGFLSLLVDCPKPKFSLQLTSSNVGSTHY